MACDYLELAGRRRERDHSGLGPQCRGALVHDDARDLLRTRGHGQRCRDRLQARQAIEARPSQLDLGQGARCVAVQPGDLDARPDPRDELAAGEDGFAMSSSAPAPSTSSAVASSARAVSDHREILRLRVGPQGAQQREAVDPASWSASTRSGPLHLRERRGTSTAVVTRHLGRAATEIVAQIGVVVDNRT